MKITSLKNPRILAWRKLYKSRDRKDAPVFLVEGVREVLRGLEAGFSAQSLMYCPDIITPQDLELITGLISSSTQCLELSKEVYEKLAYRDKTEGVIGVFTKRTMTLEDLDPTSGSPFILLENMEKPGNLGAVLRTADAVRCPGVIITGHKLDPWHPNVIRASQGGVFTVPVVLSDNEEVHRWCKEQSLPIFATALPSYGSMYDIPIGQSCVMAFGTEATGLSPYWMEHAEECFTIPMEGKVDSLNVSVAVAVALYESVRQRTV